jgi:transposase
LAEGVSLSLALPTDVSHYVGVDWGTQHHTVCILRGDGRIAARFTITHSVQGFRQLHARLAAFGDPAEVPVAIERPDGRLVDALLEAGHPVVPVKPHAIKQWRDGEVLSGAKSDAGDAEVIAEYLRLRAHRLRVATPYSSETKALRTLVRTRDDLVDMRVAATNQLAALLDAQWPGAKAIFANIESPIALHFLARYPTPAAATHLGEKRIAAFCRQHGYSGRRPAAELLDRLRSAPAGPTDPAVTEALRDSVLALVAVLRCLNNGVKTIDTGLSRRLEQHPDGKIFTSLPRSGTINAAQILASWGDCRDAYHSPDAVAALAGLTPVTKESGKHRAVSFRWACNKRFRQAMTIYADNSRHASPWAANIYANARAAGKDHPHAIRVLARAWTRVIYRCWQDGVPYNPEHHGAAQRLADTRSAA